MLIELSAELLIFDWVKMIKVLVFQIQILVDNHFYLPNGLPNQSLNLVLLSHTSPIFTHLQAYILSQSDQYLYLLCTDHKEKNSLLEHCGDEL